MARLFPNQYAAVISAEDAERANMAVLAYQMKRWPSEIRQQPAQDIWDILGVISDEAERNKPGY